jgi:short-subunit dehydrogenase
MIARRRGRIVNIGSVSGVTATPFSGAYCASKFAVRAISDTLRLELAPFGVDVVEIQPGAIRSEFGATASHGLPELAGGPYAPLTAAMRRRSTMSQRKALSADDFARRVARAVLRDRPPPVVRAGPFSITLPFIGTFLPASLRNRLLRRRFGL